MTAALPGAGPGGAIDGPASVDAQPTAGPDDRDPSASSGTLGLFGGGGPYDPARDSLRALGLGGPGIPLGVRLLIEMIGIGGAVSLSMAFLVFGKRRRDGEQPAPDDVLHTAAARLMPVASATLVPATAGGLSPTSRPVVAQPGGLSPEELALPRWRRPSLLEARKADPLRSVATHKSLSFDHGSVGPLDGHERRRLRYRLVRLLDQPDELRANEIGFLDEGDEVQLLERAGAYWLVLCPDGSRGWIHKMTLGDVVDDAPVSIDAVRRSFGTGAGAAPHAVGGGASADGFGPVGFSDPADGREPADEPPDGLDDDVITAFLSARRAG